MKLRLVVFVIVLGCGAVVAGWIYERSLRPLEEQAEMAIPDDIDSFLTNVHYRSLDASGQLDFELRTPRLEHYPRGDISRFQTPSMTIQTQTEPWQVDSQKGNFRHRKNLMHLRRDVVMEKQGEAPMQVFTNSLSFDIDRELATSNTDILMISPQARIEAEYAEFDFAQQVYRFNQARAVYHNDDS